MASNELTITIGATREILESIAVIIQERDNLQTHLDLQEQALADMTRQRNEARTWAWRMRRERDALKERCAELEARLDIYYGNLADIEPPSFVHD